MRIKSPAHPGRLLKTALEELGWSVTEAAKALGVTRQQLNNVIGGRSSITAEMAIRLEKGIGAAAETWVEMQRNFDLAQVRRREADIRVSRLVQRTPASI